MTKHGCWVLAIWAGLTAAGAGASLPPLPAVWPAGSTEVPGLPLPHDGMAAGADDAVLEEAGPPPFDRAARAARQAEPAAPGPSLEGPPIPLAPPARMTDAAARQPGDADDTRRISLNLQGAGLAAAFDAFARFTGLNIVVGEQVRGTARHAHPSRRQPVARWAARRTPARWAAHRLPADPPSHWARSPRLRCRP